MPRRRDALDAAVRASARLASEQRQFRDGVRATQVGKYTKLVELLAELQFPEVVCLQEAYDLVEISRGGKSALTDRMYSMFADKSVAASSPSALTRRCHAIAAQVRHQLVGRDGRAGAAGRLPDHSRSR